MIELHQVSLTIHERKTINQNSIIIFRILQEFFSNTIKHSKATKLNVKLFYKDDEVEIIAQDNGIGFDQKQIKKAGLGLKHRGQVHLIGAKASCFNSKESTQLLLIITLKNELFRSCRDDHTLLSQAIGAMVDAFDKFSVLYTCKHGEEHLKIF